MENKIYDLLEKMYADFNERFIGLEKTTSEIKSQVNNNSLILEKIQTDIETLAEVQSSFSEQLDRAKDKDGKTLGERLDVIELAITNTSKSVNDVIDAIDVIKDTTGSHEMDIKILKRIRAKHSL
ncbi:hypothetical protein [Clostridium algidicarnis]|uniref:Uncharacterized protein n=2 Tax=Clostridium algidicarnis TaxID=37659 RepID=A0A2S6FY33_9CLOT|nr:hypothetical protein [Clostridium algidicarnis]MBB6631308.1 hypothetical protein [Clostridium algidicarnis]MBU3219804.1 hypothetical protein [Clostridium algidicarnis]PPK48379.1 hypothetical protein BD821_10716 [Clostridium algidicarnis DSM 15099]